MPEPTVSSRTLPEVVWRGATGERRASWLSPNAPLPARAGPADDRTPAAAALARARAGEALVYAGDYHNARQLLSAMRRRMARGHGPVQGAPAAAFQEDRARRAEEALVLSRLAVPIEPGWRIPLARAPDAAAACAEALGEAPGALGLLPLRDLLGMIGAHEWRRRGVLVPALGARVHPHYAVYAPVRSEYVDLVAEGCARWPPAGRRALDVGTGTGVLAILLARRGAAHVVATDAEPRAVACARENAGRLGVADRVEVFEADLWIAQGGFDVVVSNPPWLPGDAHGPLDRAIYDPGGAVLERLLLGLPDHLAPGGEAWVILSDLAELAGLRPRGHVQALAARAGMRIGDELSAKPRHPRARDADDPLHAIRSRETTFLYRIVRG